MKTIVFRHRTGVGEHDIDEQEFEFEDDTPEEEINKEFADWAWERVMDDFTWYEKGVEE
ncbi:hypothetical protein [Virgibacillus sp. Bac332]|uniref:hypothetical protein n=1 Tax=Virgibacillus sp. Bac332 TaxID=2419842 RepID=UPI0013CEB3A8|nr:hypothetical protein [Virgibacillus sp. Bac332]